MPFSKPLILTEEESSKSKELFGKYQFLIHKRTDRLFAILMLLQWTAGIALALFVSPKNWTGTDQELLIHIWTAVLLGGIITSLPVYLAIKRPGQEITRYVIAIAQMMASALLIHISGGRIETHFHVFGSLAFLSFYRDPKVLLTASLVIISDYFLRGMFWPESIFGTSIISKWRWVEYSGWVIFEDIMLLYNIKQGRKDLTRVSDSQAKLQVLNTSIEKKISERTVELNNEIVEKTRAQDEVQHRKALLQATLESTAEGILVIDDDGQIQTANKKFLELWRIPDELLGPGKEDAVREYCASQLKNPDEFMKRTMELIRGSHESVIELDFRDGRIYEEYSRPLAKVGEHSGRIVSIRDITNERESEKIQRELEDELERAQRLESLGKLAGGVAHDLNNMLGPVVGYSELLIVDLKENAKAARRAEKIKKSAEQAAVVIQDLLTLARRGKYEMRLIQFNDVITEYLESPQFERLQSNFSKIEVDVSLADEDTVIFGSAPHLSKVIMNLVTNAFEAMGTTGNLKIETSILETTNGRFVALNVKDNGPGIEKEDMDKIFEPFFSKKPMGTSGSGLGLSVVYGIVKDHKALCDVHSSPGEGTQFSLYFPFSNTKLAPKVGVQYSTVGGTETILVVDDSEEQRELSHDVIFNLGYFVVTAPDGRYAIDFVKSHPVDLVILDMIMEPGFDGLDTYQELIKMNPDQKAIIVSGYSEGDRVQEVLKLGASLFLKKPYNIDALAAAIRKALDETPSLVS